MRLPWNWRSRIEITVDEDGKDTVFNLQFIKGKTPKGFMRNIGELSTSECRPYGHVVEGSHVDEKFRRKGLGKMLYLRALEHHGSLTTFYHRASEEAQRVWKSIMRNHKHDENFLKGTLTAYYKRRVVKVK